MKQVAKLVVIDDQEKYLLMFRNNHPSFGDDPDLPGGTLEEGESPVLTMIREVDEEAGIKVSEAAVTKVYEGIEYSAYHTHYSLYAVRLASRPPVTMSWEHSAYEWLDREDFLQKVKNANDSYMRMVYDQLK